jgi:membrane associated rhomboid family serine protease
VQASVGSHCVDCARAERPNVTTRARYWNARQPTLVTYALIALNLAAFVYVGISDPGTIGGSARLTSDNPQVDLGLAANALAQGSSEYYRLVSAGFLHFGILHIALNMLLLFQLGQLLEPAIGRVRFGLLYFAALLAGSAGALFLSDPRSLTGGASGAVFGLMGAAFVGLRNRGVNPFSTGLGTALVLNLVFTFAIPGISVGGHLGGLAGGAIAGWVVLAPQHVRLPKWASYAAPALVIVASLVLSVVAVGVKT